MKEFHQNLNKRFSMIQFLILFFIDNKYKFHFGTTQLFF